MEANALSEDVVQVPEHVGVGQVRLWVALLRVDEGREQLRIADEENRSVISCVASSVEIAADG